MKRVKPDFAVVPFLSATLCTMTLATLMSPSVQAQAPVVAQPVPVVAPVPTAEPQRTLQDYAIAALNQAFDETGLAGTERAVFNAEALAEPFLFVSNYETTAEGTNVRVDHEKLKNFVRFSSQLYANTKICVVVRAADDCSLCNLLKRDVQALATQKFEKRGFGVKNTLEVPEGASLSGEKAFDYYLARMGEAQCDGLFYDEIVRDSPGEETSEVAGDVRVKSAAFLQVKDSTDRKIKSKGQAVVQIPANLKTYPEPKQAPVRLKFAQTLINRESAELFASAAGQVSRIVRTGGEERYLKLVGVTSYDDYARFKQGLLDQDPALNLEERFISQGTFHFAVSGEVKLPDLVALVRKIPGGHGSREFHVVDAGQKELTVVVK